MTALRRQMGFTLLEVLVALVILGFIVSGLAGGTWLGMKASDLQVHDAVEQQDLQPVDQLLRRLMGTITRPSDPELPGVVGSRTRLICITRDPRSSVAGMEGRVDAVLDADAGHRLLLRWTPHVHAVPLGGRAVPLEQVLLDGVERIEFSYLSPDRTEWLGGWSRADLPALVRIQLIFVPGDGRRWPPIVAAVREG